MIWRPQKGPQKSLIDCPVPEIFYGGARGGGKTDGVLGKYALKAEMYGSSFNGIFFRKELPMLDDAIERSASIYEQIGAKWHEQKKMWRFPGGGRLRFRPLERTLDADKYQGQNISDACIEEAGQYADPAPIDRINGVLRSADGTPTQLILTGNPGGAGQQWIKARYIDPFPSGNRVMYRELPNGEKHPFVYIPSRLQNNEILMRGDPNYINRLYLVGSKKLVSAWLSGDWSAIEGAFFDEWDSSSHIVAPFDIPPHWMRMISGDWGSAKPFSFGWWAVASEDYFTNGVWIPRGAMVRYQEWYGVRRNDQGQIEPNKGLKLTADEVGKGLAERGCDVDRAVLDPAAFSEDGGPSIASRIRDAGGPYFQRADNKRVARHGALGGWDQMRARLKGDDFGDPMGVRPMLYCFSTCTDSIRTIPSLQHDSVRAEDLDSDAEDHAADDWRYACMARPYVKEIYEPETKSRDPWERIVDEIEDGSWKTA